MYAMRFQIERNKTNSSPDNLGLKMFRWIDYTYWNSHFLCFIVCTNSIGNDPSIRLSIHPSCGQWYWMDNRSNSSYRQQLLESSIAVCVSKRKTNATTNPVSWKHFFFSSLKWNRCSRQCDWSIRCTIEKSTAHCWFNQYFDTQARCGQ